MAKLHINLTMHVGRHTFATWALTKGVGIETVSKMLAPSNVAMTERYARVLQSSVIQGYQLLKKPAAPDLILQVNSVISLFPIIYDRITTKKAR